MFGVIMYSVLTGFLIGFLTGIAAMGSAIKRRDAEFVSYLNEEIAKLERNRNESF